MKLSQEFRSSWSVCWVTTYSFDPGLFEEFLLRRLGDTPLNVTVLADFSRLSRTWEEHSSGLAHEVRRANRDYVVRGVQCEGAFHPKTYFLANKRGGVLLVGSGNLTLSGIEQGREIFGRYDSTRAMDLQALRDWRDWMRALVHHMDDLRVGERWRALERELTWLEGPRTSSSFVTNLESSLLEQLVAKSKAPVEELHVMAPFFDENALALSTLIERLRPTTLVLYVGRSTKVNGEALESVIATAAEVVLRGYDPDEFTHAKMIAAIDGSMGTLLSGSANVSNAALRWPAEHPGANWEAGTIVRLPADRLRELFTPRDTALIDFDRSDVRHLRYEVDEEDVDVEAYRFRLQSVEIDEDRHLRAAFEPRADTNELSLTDGNQVMAVVDGRTREACELDGLSSFLWLSDVSGESVLSNRVPIDDKVRLARQLREAGTTGRTTPKELLPQDLNTPVGGMLARLWDTCVFDFDETEAARTQQMAEEESEADEAFWERMTREELKADPRSGYYRRQLRTQNADSDPIIEMMISMRDRVPGPLSLRLLREALLEEEGAEGDEDAPTPDRSWSPDRRIQLRLFNVLDRWCRAMGDPRMSWLSDKVPVRNYVALLQALVECWHEDYFDGQPDQPWIVKLIGRLHFAFLRSEETLGYLCRLSEDERDAVLREYRDLGVNSLASALMYASLRPGVRGWKDYIFSWQPFLELGLGWGLFQPTDQTLSLLVTMKAGDAGLSHEAITDRLRWAAHYIDDERWCELQERQIGFDSITLERERKRGDLDIIIHAEADLDLLRDPRVVRLARRAMQYKGVHGAIVDMAQGRVAIRHGESVFARTKGDAEAIYASVEPVDFTRMVELETQGAGWDAVLEEESA